MARLARCLPIFLIAASLAIEPGAVAQTIQSVHVFASAGTFEGADSFYLEIRGHSLPVTNPTVFLAPNQGVYVQPRVISATDALVVVNFSAVKDYFPSTVGIAGTGSPTSTFDVSPNTNDHLDRPRIDDVEVLQMDRKIGTGSIKVTGSHFGSDPSKISAIVVPRDPGLPTFAPVSSQSNYSCPPSTPAQRALPPTVKAAKDDVVVVDFSFACTEGYSAPFGIARVGLTVQNATSTASTSTSFELRPGQDKNLTYRSTILSQKQASSRFGGGVAKNFYVVQLSIVNKGPSKIQVPLASIQAEVQWYAGQLKEKFYLEGPATVAPVPLAGAVSYFSTHRQSTGARARFFNTLQGLTTVGSAVQLFFGPGFAQAVGIAGGGLRQGLGQIFQDLSDQQLANLTSQSFESIETVSGNGGSIEKVVFIQRGEERLPSTFRRLITNIQGFEITGYEVPKHLRKLQHHNPNRKGGREMADPRRNPHPGDATQPEADLLAIVASPQPGPVPGPQPGPTPGPQPGPKPEPQIDLAAVNAKPGRGNKKKSKGS